MDLPCTQKCPRRDVDCRAVVIRVLLLGHDELVETTSSGSVWLKRHTAHIDIINCPFSDMATKVWLGCDGEVATHAKAVVTGVAFLGKSELYITAIHFTLMATPTRFSAM